MQHFVNSISRLLLPVDGAHAACCEEMANAMANSEAAALKGLQTCIDTILAEVCILCDFPSILGVEIPSELDYSYPHLAVRQDSIHLGKSCS